MRRVITMPGKEELYEDYAVNGLTLTQIAKKYGAKSGTTAKKWMEKCDITSRVKRNNIPVPEKEILRKMYLIDNMEIRDIAEHFGVSLATASRWLYSCGLRVKHEYRRTFVPEKEVLRKMYLIENMETQEIAEHFSVSRATAAGWLHGYGLDVKQENRRTSIPGKETLCKMYLTENMSAREIAEHFSVSMTTAFRWLRDDGLTVKRKNACYEVPPSVDIDVKATKTKA